MGTPDPSWWSQGTEQRWPTDPPCPQTTKVVVTADCCFLKINSLYLTSWTPPKQQNGAVKYMQRSIFLWVCNPGSLQPFSHLPTFEKCEMPVSKDWPSTSLGPSLRALSNSLLTSLLRYLPFSRRDLFWITTVDFVNGLHQTLVSYCKANQGLNLQHVVVIYFVAAAWGIFSALSFFFFFPAVPQVIWGKCLQEKKLKTSYLTLK